LLDNGTIVTVVALPAAGWRVASWSGGCTGTTPGCAVAMSAAETASVTFVRSPLRIAVKLTGKGRITSSPGGIACSKACAHSFAAGGSVRLRAIAARGWRFAGWSGACAGRGACVLTEAATAGARFVRR
jgi:hypothetical protein